MDSPPGRTGGPEVEAVAKLALRIVGLVPCAAGLEAAVTTRVEDDRIPAADRRSYREIRCSVFPLRRD